MAIEKQDLREAYDTSINTSDKVGDYTDSVLLYAIGLLIGSGMINMVFVASLGIGGVIFAIIVQFFVLYLITRKLLTTIDELVTRKINNREEEILEIIGEKE